MPPHHNKSSRPKGYRQKTGTLKLDVSKINPDPVEDRSSNKFDDIAFVRLIPNPLARKGLRPKKFSRIKPFFSTFQYCMTVSSMDNSLEERILKYRKSRSSSFGFLDYSNKQDQGGNFVFYFKSKDQIREIVTYIFSGNKIFSNFEKKEINENILLNKAISFSRINKKLLRRAAV